MRFITPRNLDSHNNERINGVRDEGFVTVGHDSTFNARQDRGIVHVEPAQSVAIDFSFLADTLPQTIVVEQLPETPDVQKGPKHLAKAKFGYGAIKAVKGLVK